MTTIIRVLVGLGGHTPNSTTYVVAPYGIVRGEPS